MEDIKDRVKQVMDRENLTSGAFADSIGVSPATITHILNGRNKYPSTEVLLRLHNRYPDVSLQWLLLGEGDGIDAPTFDQDDLFNEGEKAVNPSNDTESSENRRRRFFRSLLKLSIKKGLSGKSLKLGFSLMITPMKRLLRLKIRDLE